MKVKFAGFIKKVISAGLIATFLTFGVGETSPVIANSVSSENFENAADVTGANLENYPEEVNAAEEEYESAAGFIGGNRLISPNEAANKAKINPVEVLTPAQRKLKLADVRTEEPNVGGVVILVLSFLAITIIAAPIFCKKKRKK